MHSPNSLFPQLLRKHDRPHSILTVLNQSLSIRSRLGPRLSLVADYLSIHTSLDHPEEHSLHCAVQLVILRLLVCRLDICENCLANEGSECGRGGARKEGEECL